MSVIIAYAHTGIATLVYLFNHYCTGTVHYYEVVYVAMYGTDSSSSETYKKYNVSLRDNFWDELRWVKIVYLATFTYVAMETAGIFQTLSTSATLLFSGLKGYIWPALDMCENEENINAVRCVCASLMLFVLIVYQHFSLM